MYRGPPIIIDTRAWFTLHSDRHRTGFCTVQYMFALCGRHLPRLLATCPSRHPPCLFTGTVCVPAPPGVFLPVPYSIDEVLASENVYLLVRDSSARRDDEASRPRVLCRRRTMRRDAESP